MDDEKKRSSRDFDIDEFEEPDVPIKKGDTKIRGERDPSFYDDMPEDIANYLSETHPLKKREQEESTVRERRIRKPDYSDNTHKTESESRSYTHSGRSTTTVQGLLSNSHFMSRVAVILAVILALLIILFLTLQNSSLKKELAESKTDSTKMNELVLLNNDLRTSKSALLREIEALKDDSTATGKDDVDIDNDPSQQNVGDNDNDSDQQNTTTTAPSDESQPITDETMYTVVKGDNISKISQKFYKSSAPAYIDKIVEANNLKNPDAISVGMVLKIPPLE